MPKVARPPDSPLLRRLLQRQAARAAVRNDYAVGLAQAGQFTTYAAARDRADREFRRVERGR